MGKKDTDKAWAKKGGDGDGVVKKYENPMGRKNQAKQGEANMPLRMEMQKRDGNCCDTLQNSDAKASWARDPWRPLKGPTCRQMNRRRRSKSWRLGAAICGSWC